MYGELHIQRKSVPFVICHEEVRIKMAATGFWFLVFGALASLSILRTESEEIPPLHIRDNDCASLDESSSITQLTMVPRKSNAPCHELEVCGIDMCITTGEGGSKYVDSGKQSSVRNIHKNPEPHKKKNCICNSNDAVLVSMQVLMEFLAQDFVEYRVQEVSEIGCKGVICDWRLMIFTSVPDEHGGNNDVSRCIRSKICKVVCHLRTSKLLQKTSYSFTFVAIMVLLSVMSVLSCITLNSCQKYGRPSPDDQGKDVETKPNQKDKYRTRSSGDISDDSEDDISNCEKTEYDEYQQRHLPRHDDCSEKEPAHLKHRMRL